ncbi:MAG: ATP-dependent DNA helicase [Candidatus Methanomethylophilaceae archaeon]|nr:ATP-dependent DNA helicase [Candidatus Methanomethylophilaceae archaeon]
MDIFPYQYRPGQRELVGFLDRSVRESRRAVVEAGTGTGKTITSLCGTLPCAMESGCKVVYLTRTKSQQKQIVRECAAIKADVLCVAIQGRSSVSCPLMRDDPELSSGTPEEISKLCSEYKKRDANGCRHCSFFDNVETADLDRWESVIRTEHLEPEEFADRCEAEGVCPYELQKLLLPKADVICAPYPFVFIPQILDHFVQWTGTPLSRAILVVDEAHNLPDYLRDVQTAELGMRSLARADKEAREYGDPDMHEDIKLTDVIAVVEEIIRYAGKEYLMDDDGLLPPYFLEDELMTRLGVSSIAIRRICKAMEDFGSMVEEKRKARRKLPRTYVGHLAAFLNFWSMADELTYVQLIVGEEGNHKLQTYCMDPSGAAGPLRDCRSAVLMSGTLAPLDEYARELGVEDPAKLMMTSQFPVGNLLKLYCDKVTMKYDERFLEENYRMLMDGVVGTVNAVRVNTAVFFPSYQMMDRMIADGLEERLNREIFYERRGMQQAELMDAFERFRMSEGGVLFCVTGGRISEGLDFPDKTLELAVLIGIPFPKPTAKVRAMQRYYDHMTGDGTLYTVYIPASRKMRQAMGRLIRSETDRGVAAIFDKRVHVLPDVDAEACDDIPAAVRAFFSGRIGTFRATTWARGTCLS